VEKRKNTDTDTNLHETQSESVRHIVMMNECLAKEIKNQRGGSFDPKLLVSFHHTGNLGNLLSPRKIVITMEAELTGSHLT